MLFVYIGTEDAADPSGTHAFGPWFPINEPVPVENERAVMKLIGHPHFEAVEDGDQSEDATAQARKRRGRPPKAA